MNKVLFSALTIVALVSVAGCGKRNAHPAQPTTCGEAKEMCCCTPTCAEPTVVQTESAATPTELEGYAASASDKIVVEDIK